MSQTTKALIVKFLMTFILAGLIFTLMNNNTWGWAFVVGLVGTIANYLLGDLLILPKLGNFVASVCDGILAILVAYLVDVLTPAFNTTIGSLALFGILVLIGEYFFHQFLLRSDKVEP